MSFFIYIFIGFIYTYISFENMRTKMGADIKNDFPILAVFGTIIITSLLWPISMFIDLYYSTKRK